ncbi:MAG: GGDEF domain-containing protein [Terracidiphilus sp.]|jgi:diguanylate cyclase (GGDEF)-like protein
MKRLIPLFAVLLGWASTAWAAAPAELTTLRSIVSLTNAEADKHHPVAFEATVTYRSALAYTMFVQDDGVAVFVRIQPSFKIDPGDRVLVKGTTQGSFSPIVVAESVTVLRHGTLPQPVPATYDELIRIHYDCVLVTVHGIVRAADSHTDAQGTTAMLQLLTDGGYMRVNIDNYVIGSLEDLLDAEVEVIGVAAGEFDGKMQLHGVGILSASPEYLKILTRARSNPWYLSPTPMGQIINAYHVIDHSQRIMVHGTITYYQPGESVVLQRGSTSLWISTGTYDRLNVGDVVDATGFPEAHNGFLALTRAEIQDTHLQAPITPLPTTRKELALSAHVIDLVSVEGQVVTAVRGGTQDEYHLMADGQMFTAVYRHPPIGTHWPDMKPAPIGSTVRVAGICITENSNPFVGETAFDILMRNFDDIEVVARPSMVNTRNLMLALLLLLAVIIAVSSWGWALRRKVRIQTAALSVRIEAEAASERRIAQLEQKRSIILEDINGSRPLAEVLEKITELISFMLHDAPCWCEVADGERLGNKPPETKEPSIVSAEIPARSGPALGTLFVAVDSALLPNAALSSDYAREALSVGARLATLAIETRRLYSDLRRRSEFDLLTDVPNRFAMEKFMESQIEEASRSDAILGLIYIDLDKFKPINDTYGHHVGDLYLQAVALRMSRQLLGGDMLARLGGDEFAALVSLQNGRPDLDKIIARLQGCFSEPFSVEGILLHGEASIGVALFPQDGATKDSLLSAADAAMYAIKNSKRQATAGSLPGLN